MEHIVEPDEHLVAIAHKHGFSISKSIWNLKENAELKNLRKNRLILLGGDRVFIPELASKDERGQTNRRHVFAAAREGLELHVKVHNQAFEPIHGEATLTAGSTQTAMPQRGDIFQAPVRPDVTGAVLDFPISKTERQHPQIPIQVGRLDPLETLSGQQQRLNNLGYFAGFVEPEDPKSPNSQFRWAVEEFQCDHMGPSKVDGVLGPQTLAKLKEVYGC